MIDLDTEICVCNSLTVKDIAIVIKEHKLHDLEELIKNTDCPMGDKCEACLDEGYNNDGLNIPMVISMVKRGVL
ncbi:(2Fe-2S)-binding protein [Sulfurimonas sp.]|nr:(2Fe-2S)-binding protein [Sulfurimonas sp.]